MEETKNIKLKKPAESNTFGQLIEAINANADILDAIPLPADAGGNGELSYWKFSDGTVFMWGRRNDDSLNCNTQIRDSGIYKSTPRAISFPIPIVSLSAMVLNGSPDHERSSKGYGHSETEAYMHSQNQTGLEYYYTTPLDEGEYSSGNKWAKTCNIFMIGKWK